MVLMASGGGGLDERRRTGAALQAKLPVPSKRAQRREERRRPAGRDAAAEVLDEVVEGVPWGPLLDLPGFVRRVYRRLRRR
jgi:hypothetical protein